MFLWRETAAVTVNRSPQNATDPANHGRAYRVSPTATTATTATTVPPIAPEPPPHTQALAPLPVLQRATTHLKDRSTEVARVFSSQSWLALLLSRAPPCPAMAHLVPLWQVRLDRGLWGHRRPLCCLWHRRERRGQRVRLCCAYSTLYFVFDSCPSPPGIPKPAVMSSVPKCSPGAATLTRIYPIPPRLP